MMNRPWDISALLPVDVMEEHAEAIEGNNEREDRINGTGK
jgi:hypothetical protein